MKKEKKAIFPLRSETQVSYLPSSHDASMSESWDGSDADSFDDDDYEDPDEPDDVEDYETPAPEDEDSANSDGYEPPPSNDIHPINPPKPSSSNSDYIDRPLQSNSVRNPPNPSNRTGVSTFTSRGNTFPGVQSSSSQDSPRLAKPKPLAPSVDRTTKPNIQVNSGKLSSTSGKNLSGQAKAVTLPANIRPSVKPEHLRKPALPSQSSDRSSYPSHIPDAEDISSPEENAQWRLQTHHSNTFPSTSPKPSIRSMGSGSNTLPTPDISHSAAPPVHRCIPLPPYKSDGSLNGRPPAPIPVTSVPQISTPGNDGIHSEKWYFGKISRKDAENALRSVNTDGTFLVRNCSQSTMTQPYVLMVLYKNKVYNVRIRYDKNNEVYLLGSGGHETFDSVSEIIDFFRKSPLLLIDGKDRGSRQHGKLTCIADKSFM